MSARSRSFRGLLELCAAHLGGGVLNGLDDVLVAGAAAEIARNAGADVVFARVRVLLKQPPGAGDHAGSAKPTLQAMHLAKAFLERMQRSIRSSNPLDGDDRGAVGLHREDGAGLHRLAVEIDGAGAAMGRLAADMRPGKAEMLAQEVDQKGSRLDQAFDRLAVDRHRNVGLLGDWAGHRTLRFSGPATCLVCQRSGALEGA